MSRPIPRQLDADPTPGARPTEIYRDRDLLVVNKPAGWLTHPDGTNKRPDVLSALGEPGLGVHQRLDVDTSGVLALSRTPEGAKRLQHALERHQAKKRYIAVVDGGPAQTKGTLKGPVPGAPGKPAETLWKVLRRDQQTTLMQAMPITGRTHQIRAHFARAGWPIRGDARYGDALDRRAPRTLLHCASLNLGDGLRFEAPTPPEFARHLGQSADALRAGLEADEGTTCYRLRNGAADGCPGWLVDRYGDWIRVQANGVGELPALPYASGLYRIEGLQDRSSGEQVLAQLMEGRPAPRPLKVREHGVNYLVDMEAQLSTGLFLDQRPQRAWLRQHAGGMRVLNTFAHAGGFSVAAGCAGAKTVSVDLSKTWLARIHPQLEANGVNTADHDTIYGDVFDWLRRLVKRGERFDLVILDPPSTSVGKRKKRWSAARDYPELVKLAAPLVAPGGLMWTAMNHSKTSPGTFAERVMSALPSGSRLDRVCPPAVDFPTDETFSVKTHVWRLPR